MPKPSISMAEFEALAARTGLKLTPQQKTELYQGYAFIEAMAARVRGTGAPAPEADLALVFRPQGDAP